MGSNINECKAKITTAKITMAKIIIAKAKREREEVLYVPRYENSGIISQVLLSQKKTGGYGRMRKYLGRSLYIHMGQRLWDCPI